MAESMPSTRVRRWAALLLACVTALLAIAVLWPLHQAKLHTDDWAWLALAHEATSPWPAYAQGLMFGYFYRPTAFVSWFVAERLLGDDAALHYAASVLTHGLTVIALGSWLRALGAKPLAIAAALALFAFSPATTSLALWQSNRNEALAVLAGVLALRAGLLPGGTRLPLLALLLGLSITSKETGVLFAAVVLAQAVLRPERAMRARLADIATVLGTLALVLAVRSAVVLPVDPAAEGDDSLLAAIAVGVPAWWRHLAEAWTGMAGPWPTVLTLVAVCGVIGAAALRSRLADARALPAIGLLLLLAPAVIQSPITSLVLVAPDALDVLVNQRFYAIAALGFALLVAGAWPARASWAWPLGLVVALWVITMAWGSHRNAERWVAETQSMHIDAPLVAAAVARKVMPPPDGAPCVVDVQGMPLPPGARPYFDAMLRLQWPKGDALERCLFAADGQLPWVAFMPAEACSADQWQAASLKVATPGGTRLVETMAGACQIALRPEGGRLEPTHVLAWSTLLAEPAARMPTQ